MDFFTVCAIVVPLAFLYYIIKHGKEHFKDW